jgi:endonuclease/exonuclease/phosphatase (EEP) superfamily protein YafD
MRKLTLIIGSGLFAVGCSWNAAAILDDAPSAEVEACIADPDRPRTADAGALDKAGFSIVNWNIQKGRDARWISDLQTVHSVPDLLILQEASPTSDAWNVVAPNHFRSFAAGFGFGGTTSGVVTASSAQPLLECRLAAFEPWLGTPKATLITEYALADTASTLLVVNIHGINFSFGVQDMREQLLKAAAIIERHAGPVLFSGDFNTWREGRAQIVDDIVNRLGLVALDYEMDHRKKVFGWALDHIYVRGLETVYATSVDLESSDHNPMAVKLRLGPNVDTSEVVL